MSPTDFYCYLLLLLLLVYTSHSISGKRCVCVYSFFAFLRLFRARVYDRAVYIIYIYITF